MRVRASLTCAALAAALVVTGTIFAATSEPDDLSVRARQIALNVERSAVTRVGRLEYRGGLSLSSSHSAFGGFSALIVSPDGERLLAVSDRGTWFSATPLYDTDGRLVDISDPQIAPIRDRRGRRLDGWMADAESLALLSDGTLLVSFERYHRVLGYRLDSQELPGAMKLGSLGSSARYNFPRRAVGKANDGLEAVAETAEGLVLAIAEGSDDDEEPSAAFLFSAEGMAQALRYDRSDGFRPTAAHRLRDGAILVLERRFSWIGGVSARLRRIEPEQIRPGALLNGEEIATLIPPVSVDNMEGLAVRDGPDGETLIYLISDDNFNALQRTLLMMFALVE